MISATNLGNDWTTKEIEIWDWDNKQKVTFNNLDATQKKTVIEKINDIKDEEKRAIFGNVAELKIKDWDNEQVYKFDQKNWYVIQNGSQPTT